MAKYKGWKNRYSYLDDYKPGLDGKYVYYGRHYVLEGGRERWRSLQWLMGGTSALVLALLIVTGILDAGAYWSMWYTNLTYMFKVIAAFLIIWKSLALITEKYPVKQYIYKKTVPWYKPCACLIAVTGALSAVAAFICILSKPEGMILSGCILEVVLNLVTAACGVILFIMLKRYLWEPDPTEEVQE